MYHQSLAPIINLEYYESFSPFNLFSGTLVNFECNVINHFTLVLSYIPEPITCLFEHFD